MSTVPLNLETDAVALPQHARWVAATLEQAFERRRSSCAGTGLAAAVRGLIDRRQLAHALGLRLTQRIVLAQTVGYPGLGA